MAQRTPYDESASRRAGYCADFYEGATLRSPAHPIRRAPARYADAPPPTRRRTPPTRSGGYAPARVPRRRKRANPLGRMMAVAALGLLGAAGAYAGYVYRHSEALRRYAPDLIGSGDVAAAFPGQSAINLTVIGRDYDYNDKDQVILTHARSDMLMEARIDFAARTARILSIPRDTAAAIPGHGVTKINAAHDYGGPRLTDATIQQNYGIAPDHYIALDFQGFQEAIDKLGGVDLTVDKKLDYDDNWGHLHIHLLPGYQHLDGYQAMGFVRMRHSDSDFVRTQRQQALLTALKAKMVQPITLAMLPAVLDTVDKHIDSDLTDRQKIVLARFLHSLPPSSVQMVTLPSDESGNTVRTDWAKSAPIIKAWFGVDAPATRDETDTAGTPTIAVTRSRRHWHRRRRADAQLASDSPRQPGGSDPASASAEPVD